MVASHEANYLPLRRHFQHFAAVPICCARSPCLLNAPLCPLYALLLLPSCSLCSSSGSKVVVQSSIGRVSDKRQIVTNLLRYSNTPLVSLSLYLQIYNFYFKTQIDLSIQEDNN